MRLIINQPPKHKWGLKKQTTMKILLSFIALLSAIGTLININNDKLKFWFIIWLVASVMYVIIDKQSKK